MRVENMMSRRSDREVANQFIITSEDTTLFQSYQSPIVEIDWKDKTIFVYRGWEYSQTTGKYRNQFMDDYGFNEMSTKAGFLKYLNTGVIKGFKVLKKF